MCLCSYKILMLDKSLLPKCTDIEKIIAEHDKIFIAHHISSPTVLDRNGHIAQHFTDDDEKKYYSILQQYQWQLLLQRRLINEIFLTAIQKNKLSADILLDFLNKHSWFGKNLSKRLPNGETIPHNWLNLIAPALQEYFSQMFYCLLNPITNTPNFILCIDSLTLKIEGLIRDMCQFSGVTTFYQVEDEKKRPVMREKDINRLLREEPIKQLFDEDDLLFFKFLLVEKAGYNLRHDVAHSLMLFQEYHIDLMHLLILALLRIGKYDFVEK
jgi:hypothetical protein